MNTAKLFLKSWEKQMTSNHFILVIQFLLNQFDMLNVVFNRYEQQHIVKETNELHLTVILI